MNQANRIRTGILFALLVLFVIVTRFHTYDEPLESDITAYSLMAKELRSGRSLYSDLWDHKPPAVYVTYALAQMITGIGPGSVYLLGAAAALITMLGVYAAASTGGRGQTVGLFGAAFYAVVSGDLYLEANQPNVEVFMNVCLIWAFVLMLRVENRAWGWKDSLLTGFLFVLASFYKTITVFNSAALAIAHLACPPGGPSERRRAFNQILVMAGVGFAGWLLLGLYFLAIGHFVDFWEAVIVFNRFYAQSLLGNIVSGLDPSNLLKENINSLLPLIGVSLLGAGMGNWRNPSRSGALLLAYAVSVFLMVSLPGRFFPHYYQLWLPVLAVAGAWTLAAIKDRALKDNGKRILGMGAAILVLLLLIQMPSYRLTKEKWSFEKYGLKFNLLIYAGQWINACLKPDESFFVWGLGSGLYYYSGRSPVTGLFNHRSLTKGPLVEKHFRRVVDQVSGKMPELFIIRPMAEKDLPVLDWFLARYEPFPNIKGLIQYRFYYLKGGELEKRLANPDLRRQIEEKIRSAWQAGPNFYG